PAVSLSLIVTLNTSAGSGSRRLLYAGSALVTSVVIWSVSPLSSSMSSLTAEVVIVCGVFQVSSVMVSIVGVPYVSQNVGLGVQLALASTIVMFAIGIVAGLIVKLCDAPPSVTVNGPELLTSKAAVSLSCTDTVCAPPDTTATIAL